jgi:hypothetical protein
MKKETNLLFACMMSFTGVAQPPTAGFTVSPNPVCSGNTVQITDLSTGNPTSWSYTIFTGGPGGQTLSAQNPTFTANVPGTTTIALVASNASGPSQVARVTLTVLPSPAAQIQQPLKNTCVGGNATTITVVTGFGGATYTYSWSTGATASMITVQPSVTTIYSVVVTSTNGCSVVRTSTVNVGSPTVTINSFPFSLCPGSDATLSAISTPPGPFTYTWSNASNANPIVANVAGVYGVTVTNGQNCTGTQSFTLTSSSSLSVNAIANPTAICRGNSANLSATGGTSYAWSNGAIGQTQMVTPTVTTSYSVTGYYGTCTGVATVTLVVSVIPTITAVSSPTSLCEGLSATLSANGAATYTWLPSTISQTTVVTPTATTTYSVRGQNPGCAARVSTVSVNVLAKPALSVSASADTICAGDPVALAAMGAASFTWTPGGNSAVMIVNPVSTTTYTLAGTSSNQCTAEITYVQNVNACVSVSELTRHSALSVYPNPSDGRFTVLSPDSDVIRITDLQGRVIEKLDVSAGSSRDVRLPPGLYIVSGASDPSRALKVIVTR